MNLYELIHEFLFDCKVRELSDQTIKNYDRQLHKFRSFVRENYEVIQFEELKPIHVKQYVSSLQDRGYSSYSSSLRGDNPDESISYRFNLKGELVLKDGSDTYTKDK